MSDGEILKSGSDQQPQPKVSHLGSSTTTIGPQLSSSSANSCEKISPAPSAAEKRPTELLTQENAQKRRFALFVKILFKQLQQSQESSPELCEMARTIVLDCTRRNRLNDPDYIPLMDAVDRRLRRHVGEAHWRKAHLYMQQYMTREECRNKAPGLPKPTRVAMV
jgi:hypothetical protein